MAYFVKKTNNKKGTYLQIYFSYYNPDKGMSCHKSYKPIGYVHELKAAGIEDPISDTQRQVDELNKKFQEDKQKDKLKMIGDTTPIKHLGYFPIKNINDNLEIENDINLLQINTKQQYKLYDMISALIYARVTDPKSKLHTFENVIPTLFEEYDFSLNQLYSGLEFMGSEYQKIIEIYNEKVNDKYKFKTDITYFDATNFYFEIDREDLFRRKGPSKENRKEPIVGLGLLLDANQIPMGMQLFPGNTSEKGIINEVISNMKSRHHVEGRTIRVADKGLNTANNINDCIESGDGYLFSKSVKQLPENEITWVKLPNQWHEVYDEKGELHYKYKETTDEFEYTVDTVFGKRKVKFTEKRVLTYNPKLAKKQQAEITRQVNKAVNLCVSKAKRNELGSCGKYVKFVPVDENGETGNGNSIAVSVNKDAKKKDMELCGYNLLVTSETNMNAVEIYNLYHNLWRIEESFRVMKSELDARPVFLQKENTICGHFLICYLCVLLFRIFQIHILSDEFGYQTIIRFIKAFSVFKSSPRKYINTTKSTPFINDLAKKFDIPVNHYYLNNGEIRELFSSSVTG